MRGIHFKTIAALFSVICLTAGAMSGCTQKKAEKAETVETVPAQAEKVVKEPEKHEVEAVGEVDGKTEGAAGIDGKIDIADSPYFAVPDYYNGDITDSLHILKKFATYQQTSERSCGAACMVMIANYLDGQKLSEDELDKEMDIRYYDNPREDGSVGASTESLVKAFTDRGYKVTSSKDTADTDGYSFSTEEDFAEYVTEQLLAGNPIMTENVDWGGHWMVLIGYDNMWTESVLDDVLVFADPYDTSDQYQDGYLTKNFEKFYCEWFDSKVMRADERIQQYITVAK